MQTFFPVLRFGFRMLRCSPGFSALIFLSLIFGIDSNAAVLRWIEGILFRQFPAFAHAVRSISTPARMMS